MADKSKDNKPVPLDPSRGRKKSRALLPKGQKAHVVPFPKGGREGRNLFAAELKATSGAQAPLLKPTWWARLLILLCLLTLAVSIAWASWLQIDVMISGDGKVVPSSRLQMVQNRNRELIEIAPSEDTLLIETRINTRELALLKIGSRAVIQLTTYDFATYRGLEDGIEGVVDHIGTDAMTDEGDNSFYLVRIRTNKNSFGSDQQPLEIIPGMHVRVSIVTGKQTVLSHLFESVSKAGW